MYVNKKYLNTHCFWSRGNLKLASLVDNHQVHHQNNVSENNIICHQILLIKHKAHPKIQNSKLV